ncbi:hypothetical protein LH128_01839 [Sphingomonas sp. LH128]|uniref:hypothetical protein n=1 Tax=Sphingomonas sp. LH128 TaxID=473781 RepID=UPI00027C96C9|nr:hypothetical protein [Sphingomonas sp. LH128]EJU14805.1 hypothetical protein LH128_01839 [Sphingomonas sp. LH128]
MINIEELDAIYRQANWLIAKRSGSTAFKALTLGQESLDDTVAEIADLYRLSKEARRTLQPVIAGELQTGLAGAVSMAKAAVGLDGLATGGKGADAAKSAMALVKLGPKAAKAHPILAAASVAYAVGSAGWFAFHARAFNRAAYEMVKASIPASFGTDEGPDLNDSPKAASPMIGRLKDLAKRRRGIEPG